MTNIYTATQISSVISNISALIMSNSATLGGITAVYERDESPAVALQCGFIPCAYIIPIVEGKINSEFTIGHQGIKHEFPITILLYYRSDDVNSFIVSNRTYMLNMIDILSDNYAQAGYMMYKATGEVGYWETSGDIIHYSIIKVFGKMWY